MKEIKAYIREEKAVKVREALSAVGIRHMTFVHVVAIGAQCAATTSKMSIEFGCPACRMLKVEVVCLDKDELRTVELIRKNAFTGHPGDGIISVSNINRLVKIRTASESIDAL